ncbi:acyclic terpene utilization AtuA family protein [Streptomyces sp. NPDC057137]|uniref:acyclic terpene utilization AtuA family protein n=1 Tax=Streptomyces sp. NPDC057137 TaxID=3346030 RepID=UPI00363AAFB2
MATLRDCRHIVGMTGHEPIEEALRGGADVVLAGRATDTAVAAAYPLGMPPGPTWHAAKIVETVDPFRMRELAGELDVGGASYTTLDHRRVRVEGSLFHPAEQHTIKLEGARLVGHETMSFTAIRDDHILAGIEEWAAFLRKILTERVADTLGLGATEYDFDIRLYGHNAVLEDIDPADRPPREVGVTLLVRAPAQSTATAVAKIANPLMLHLPLPDMPYLPSLAFAMGSEPTTYGSSVSRP